MTNEAIPEKFNIHYDSIFSGELVYPLTLTINTHFSSNPYSLELVVPLPIDYPETEYKKAQSRVAYLLIHYDTTHRNMEIDLFFVYNTTERYKKLIRKRETFNTKGLGKYMLCRAVHYLLNTSWFDINATVTLTAAGGECFYKEQVETYTFETCMRLLNRYPAILFELVVLHYSKDLRSKLELPKSNLYDYYEKHKELVDTTVKDILNEERDNDVLLHILQNKVCEIITNRNLVTKNYKQYGFEVSRDHGAQVEMRGDVYSLLSACSINKAVIHKNIKSNPLLGLKRRKSKRKVRK
jgi:hypothetical protein